MRIRLIDNFRELSRIEIAGLVQLQNELERLEDFEERLERVRKNGKKLYKKTLGGDIVR